MKTMKLEAGAPAIIDMGEGGTIHLRIKGETVATITLVNGGDHWSLDVLDARERGAKLKGAIAWRTDEYGCIGQGQPWRTDDPIVGMLTAMLAKGDANA